MSDNIKKTDDERVLMILNEINKNDSILDLGCVDHSHLNENSSDWIHKFLYDKSDDVTGIDFEKEDIDILQKKGKEFYLNVKQFIKSMKNQKTYKATLHNYSFSKTYQEFYKLYQKEKRIFFTKI